MLFDLDDTLFDQASWLSGAWDAVADRAGALGVDRLRLRAALSRVASAGSDRGRIIDRALEEVGAAGCSVAPLVEAFRAHRSRPLRPYPGAAEALRRLRRVVPLGLVTDGDPALQRDKVACLGLTQAFDAVVFCDELGRAYRKPSPAGFLLALSKLDTAPEHAVVVGDRPSKDVAGALAAGMRAVRVLTGEYARQPDDPPAWATTSDVCAAARLIEPFLGSD